MSAVPTSCPTCPHCGHRLEEWWRGDDVRCEDDAVSRLECGACEKSYQVTASIRVIFTASVPQ